MILVGLYEPNDEAAGTFRGHAEVLRRPHLADKGFGDPLAGAAGWELLEAAAEVGVPHRSRHLALAAIALRVLLGPAQFSLGTDAILLFLAELVVGPIATENLQEGHNRIIGAACRASQRSAAETRQG